MNHLSKLKPHEKRRGTLRHYAKLRDGTVTRNVVTYDDEGRPMVSTGSVLRPGSKDWEILWSEVEV